MKVIAVILMMAAVYWVGYHIVSNYGKFVGRNYKGTRKKKGFDELDDLDEED